MCSLALLKHWDWSASQEKALQIGQQVTCRGKVILSFTFRLFVLKAERSGVRKRWVGNYSCYHH